ncbi:cyclase family protein [bacterium]|nr:cyclase family protein [bacterium]
MPVIDLTHTLSPSMTVFPGTQPPSLRQSAVIEREGYNEKEITLFSHNGTHVDAPAHIIADGTPLDAMPLTSFYGPGMIIDCRGIRDGTIGAALLSEHLSAVSGISFVLLHTGWDRHWGTPSYLIDFPVLSEEAAALIVSSGIRGAGMDTISADRHDSRDLPVHHLLLEAGLVIIENLTHLDRIGPDSFIFSCFPLNIPDADGSPVRAVAIQ